MSNSHFPPGFEVPSLRTTILNAAAQLLHIPGILSPCSKLSTQKSSLITSQIMSGTPCISWPWICIWCCRWPMSQDSPGKLQHIAAPYRTQSGTALLVSLRDLEEYLRWKHNSSFICSCVNGSFPPLPAEQQREAGCLSFAWGGQQCFPPTLEPRAAMWGAGTSPPEVVASSASLLGGREPGNGAFASRQNQPPPAGTFFAGWPGSLLQGTSISKATRVLHWIR